MNSLEYLLQPAILFFLLGVLAVVVKSDLEIPDSVLKILSLYLLFALGFKGGTELQHTAWSWAVATPLLVAVAASFLFPLAVYPIMRRKFSPVDAAAVAATYGSVSAVTFMTASSFLEVRGMAFGGYMVAALALMESPAILTGLVLARQANGGSGGSGGLSWGSVLHECLANKSVLVLLGSLLIGCVTPASGARALQPFVAGLFPGVLCFFLMDLGIVAARRIADLRAGGIYAVVFALAFPLVAGGGALLLARVLHFGVGDAVLFAILCGSGSYIAVPAAFRAALPEANPGVYVALALGVTFPFNLFIGIPLACSVARALWG
ncbi:MAG: sodium-dependent bicarbonate transport family permease [Verrucomicrobia bacterium]|nr:sodium-dependent bicarbonate transport family permease [Verrucomicrobiota bacterium]